MRQLPPYVLAEDSCLICCAFELVLANGERRKMCQPIVRAAAHFINQSGFEASPLTLAERELYRLSEGEFLFVANKEEKLPEQYRVSVANLSELALMHLENNRPCAVGLCREGVCEKSRVRRVSRLWPLYLSHSAWSEFIFAYFLLSVRIPR